jgi:hypothetical protein
MEMKLLRRRASVQKMPELLGLKVLLIKNA